MIKDIEQMREKIENTLSQILNSDDRLGPDQFLLDKYVSYISTITLSDPTADLANFGMKLMYEISMAISADSEGKKRWLSDLSSKTCAYFKFEGREIATRKKPRTEERC